MINYVMNLYQIERERKLIKLTNDKIVLQIKNSSNSIKSTSGLDVCLPIHAVLLAFSHFPNDLHI